jgi:hypothetical protein
MPIFKLTPNSSLFLLHLRRFGTRTREANHTMLLGTTKAKLEILTFWRNPLGVNLVTLCINVQGFVKVQRSLTPKRCTILCDFLPEQETKASLFCQKKFLLNAMLMLISVVYGIRTRLNTIRQQPSLDLDIYSLMRPVALCGAPSWQALSVYLLLKLNTWH